MKFSMVFSAIDKASKTMGKIMASEKKLRAASRAGAAMTDRATTKTQRLLHRTERTMAALARGARKSFNVVKNAAKAAARAVAALHRKTVELAATGFGQIGAGVQKARTGLLAGAAAITIAYGGAAVAASSLVGTASEFEKFQTILETTEGSSAKAAEAMKWVQDFAVITPYELDQVTEGFVQLRAYGLDPTNGLMMSLGDTSAAMGKPLMQAVEAIADAVTGENERLKEFGIKASKTGKMITYEYTNAAGESVRTAVEASDRLAIQQRLMAIMNEKYAGSMSRLSKTWDGMVSNLFDLWTKFQMMIMKAGLFDWMKGKLSEILETINAMEADGSLQEWATEIGNQIQSALMNMWAFGQAVVGIVRELTGYLSTAADYVGGWKNLSMILAGIAFAPTLVSTAAGLVQIATGLAALTTALMANPIVLAIAAVAGAAYLIYQNWDNIRPYFIWVWEGVKAAVSTVWEWLKTVFSWTPLGLLVSNWDGVSAALSQPIEAGKAAIDAAWAFIKMLFEWHPVSLIAQNWDSIGPALASPIETGIELIKAAWDSVKSLFGGEWMPEIDTSGLAAGMAGMSGIVKDGWDVLSGIFDSIVAGAAALGEAVGSAIDTAVSGAQAALNAIGGSTGVDRIFDQLGELAERGYSADFVQGQALTEALAAGEISLDSYRQSLDAVAAEGGTFAQTAREMVAATELLNGFKMPEPPAPKLPSVADAEGVLSKLGEIEKASGRALEEVRAAMSSVDSILSRIDFTDRGVALMRTLAEGIRQGSHLIVAATAEATQKVRDHLPSSPAKTGPLSDIHRLKFGETIAGSIRAEPMVTAMRTAAAAALTAAAPVTQNMAIASSAVPSSAAVSDLPSASEARSASAPGRTTRSGGGGSGKGPATISVTFGDTHINGGAPDAQQRLRQTAEQERRKFVRLLEKHNAKEDRKAF